MASLLLLKAEGAIETVTLEEIEVPTAEILALPLFEIPDTSTWFIVDAELLDVVI